MNLDEFWNIIDSVHSDSDGDMDRKCELLKDRLVELNQQDLRSFIDHFHAADARAYSWPLWGAAYVMHGGCSDDSFSDFRGSLISQGRKIFEAALADPESLADLDYRDEEDICYEGFQYVKYDVAENELGEIPTRKIAFPDEPSGEEWDEDSVIDLYPRLSSKYSSNDETRHAGDPKRPWWKFW